MARGKYRYRAENRERAHEQARAEQRDAAAAKDSERRRREAAAASEAQALQTEITELERQADEGTRAEVVQLEQEIQELETTLAFLTPQVTNSSRRRQASRIERLAAAEGVLPLEFIESVLSQTDGCEITVLSSGTDAAKALPTTAARQIESIRRRKRRAGRRP